MQELTVLGTQTINSREVAEMMEVRHDSLIRKIESINKDLLNGQIRSVKYWIESSYKDKSGKENRCYEVTKLGLRTLFDRMRNPKQKQVLNNLYVSIGGEFNESIVVVNRLEYEFVNALEKTLEPFNIKGIKQYNVLSYRIDYYIPSLNIAIEYDENDHKYYSYEKQELRQQEIEKELGCRFIRVSDKESHNYNVGLVIKNMFNIKVA